MHSEAGLHAGSHGGILQAPDNKTDGHRWQLPPNRVLRMSKCTESCFKGFYILVTWWLKLGSVPDLCFCFAVRKYLAWCDVGLVGQLQDLGRCHFSLRLHSHMTSAVHDCTAQVDIMVWKNSMSLL